MKLIKTIVAISLLIASFSVLPSDIFWVCAGIGGGWGFVVALLIGVISAASEDESIKMGLTAGVVVSPLFIFIGGVYALAIGTGIYLLLPFLTA